MAQTYSSQPIRLDPYHANISGVDPLYGQRVEDLNEHDRRQYEQWTARESAERIRIGNEELRRNELERSQFGQQQSNEIIRAQKTIKKPSLILYIPFFWLMAVTDILDILDLTGIGAILNRIIQIAVFIISVLVAHHSGKRIKEMSDVHTSIQAKTSQITHRIVVYRQRYAQALQYGRKLGLLKRGSVGAKAVLKISKVTKFTRAPVLKSIFANIMEFSPIGIFPWQTIFAVWTYIDHKSGFKAARIHAAQAVEEYNAAQAQEAEEFDQSQIGILESIADEAEAASDEELGKAA